MKHIKSIAPKHCDICGKKYDEADFNVMRSSGQQTVVHLNCKSCGNTYMLSVFSPAAGLIGSSRSQLNLDLSTTSEIARLAGRKAVEVDEALDAFNQLSRTNYIAEFLQQGVIRKKQTNSEAKAKT